MDRLSNVIPAAVEDLLVRELNHARAKHPAFPQTAREALPIILEELGEVAKSINDSEPPLKLYQEVAQTAVTCIRFLETNASIASQVTKGSSFADDEEKVADMLILSKDAFLDSYSYLTPEDYDVTKIELMERLTIKYAAKQVNNG
jgi:NTP pyrophosphatase (non-canonical NTP hydrolase)